MKNTVVVIDDDESMQLLFAKVFSDHGVLLIAKGTGAEGVEAVLLEAPSVVLVDLRLPDTDGLSVVKRLRERNCYVPVILMTSYGNPDIRRLTRFDRSMTYLEKPLDVSVVMEIIRKSLDAPRISHSVIVGRSQILQEAIDLATKLASTDLPVLIEGESGTGKELIGQVLHALSPRSQGPFKVFDPSTVPENLLESAVLGHERGAFTGATERQKGVFEQAHGGTLVIDEIGNLPLSLQSKLLRVLEERRLFPLGSSCPMSVDVRLVSSTNIDLGEAVKQGAFRLDVYHRLKGARIWLPPLRRRRDDIADLVAYFLAIENQKSEKTVNGVRPSAMELLEAYEWPGNVRELANSVRLAHCLAIKEIGPGDLSPEIRDANSMAPPFDLVNVEVLEHIIRAAISRGSIDLRGMVGDLTTGVESRVLARLLRGRSQSVVAAMVGLDPGSLSRKLRKLGGSIEAGVSIRPLTKGHKNDHGELP